MMTYRNVSRVRVGTDRSGGGSTAGMIYVLVPQAARRQQQPLRKCASGAIVRDDAGSPARYNHDFSCMAKTSSGLARSLA